MHDQSELGTLTQVVQAPPSLNRYIVLSPLVSPIRLGAGNEGSSPSCSPFVHSSIVLGVQLRPQFPCDFRPIWSVALTAGLDMAFPNSTPVWLHGLQGPPPTPVWNGIAPVRPWLPYPDFRCPWFTTSRGRLCLGSPFTRSLRWVFCDQSRLEFEPCGTPCLGQEAGGANQREMAFHMV